ncbi:MAG: hypothetical protein J2P37_00270 [Ktedonobacteraceae bacterium]|nr:hypothetical protein [Ktedonobacteraceae bacterium]
MDMDEDVSRCLELCLICDDDTEQVVTVVDGITIATCSVCGNEEVLSTEDEES